MQDGAPILHATPKPVAVSLMPTNGSMLLEDNEVEQLAKRLGNAFQRKLVSVGIASTPGMTTGKAPTPSPFAWETTNTALAAEKRVAAVAAHTWTNADYVGERPHDVIDIQPNIVVSITAATLRTLANGHGDGTDADRYWRRRVRSAFRPQQGRERRAPEQAQHVD